VLDKKRKKKKTYRNEETKREREELLLDIRSLNPWKRQRVTPSLEQVLMDL